MNPTVTSGTSSDTSGGGGDASQQQQQAPSGQQQTPPPADDKGFPEGTPIAEMTAEQQAAYWKHQSRKHEATAKDRADYDALKAKAAEHDKYIASQQTEQEKAVEAARAEGAAMARKATAEGYAAALFRANLGARLEGEAKDLAVRGFNASAFIGTDGALDEDAISKYAATFGGSAAQWPDTGAGKRQETKSSGLSAGAERYQQRHGKG